jgi:hypothetical protein
VYALAVWVLYLVARGFIEGTYVGFDFLMNAALILAYLFAVRFVARRGSCWRARRLLADVIRRTRRSLGTCRRRPHRRQHASEAQTGILRELATSKPTGAPLSETALEGAAPAPPSLAHDQSRSGLLAPMRLAPRSAPSNAALT